MPDPLLAVLASVPVPGNYPLPVVAGPLVDHTPPRRGFKSAGLRKLDMRTTKLKRTWTFFFTDGTKFETSDPDTAQSMLFTLIPNHPMDNR